MAEKHRFKNEREFKKRRSEQEENEEADIRSFKFHSLERRREDEKEGPTKQARKKEGPTKPPRKKEGPTKPPRKKESPTKPPRKGRLPYGDLDWGKKEFKKRDFGKKNRRFDHDEDD
jgi:putative N6-adenine-specific DNA methylase